MWVKYTIEWSFTFLAIVELVSMHIARHAYDLQLICRNPWYVNSFIKLDSLRFFPKSNPCPEQANQPRSQEQQASRPPNPQRAPAGDGDEPHN